MPIVSQRPRSLSTDPPAVATFDACSTAPTSCLTFTGSWCS